MKTEYVHVNTKSAEHRKKLKWMAKAAICKCSSKKVFLKIHRKTHEYCEIFKNSFFNRTLPVVACEMRTLAQNGLQVPFI